MGCILDWVPFFGGVSVCFLGGGVVVCVFPAVIACFADSRKRIWGRLFTILSPRLALSLVKHMFSFAMQSLIIDHSLGLLFANGSGLQGWGLATSFMCEVCNCQIAGNVRFFSRKMLLGS